MGFKTPNILINSGKSRLENIEFSGHFLAFYFGSDVRDRRYGHHWNIGGGRGNIGTLDGEGRWGGGTWGKTKEEMISLM